MDAGRVCAGEVDAAGGMELAVHGDPLAATTQQPLDLRQVPEVAAELTFAPTRTPILLAGGWA